MKIFLMSLGIPVLDSIEYQEKLRIFGYEDFKSLKEFANTSELLKIGIKLDHVKKN